VSALPASSLAPELPEPESSAPAARHGWRRTLAGHLAWNMASDLAARGASLWLSFACARMLPVKGYGRFTFALALAQYVWLAGDAVANAGFATRELARVRAEDPAAAPALGGAFWRARLTAAVVLAAVLAAVLAIVPGAAATEAVLLAASLSFLTIAAFPDWALRGSEDFHGLALANLSGAAALVILTLWVLPRWPFAWAAALAWSASFAVSAAVGLVRTRRRGVLAFSGPSLRWRSHLRRSGAFAIGAAAGIGSAQAPMILAGLWCTPHEAGLFGAGYRLVIASIGVFSILWWPLFPLLTRERPDSPVVRDALVTFSGIVLLLGLPLALACAIFPAAILSLLFGPAYAGGAAALRLAGLAMPLYAVSGLLEQVSLARGRELLRVRTQFIALAVMLAAAALLIPRLGASGAALALLAGFAWIHAAYLTALRHELPLAAMARRAASVGALAATLGVFWWGAAAIALPAIPMLLAGGAGYAGAALATGLLPLPGAREAA
jgi:O-antigen/teichoic acid export membrane protein